MQRWSTKQWNSVFHSGNPTIRKVINSLGLSASSSTYGAPKFENPKYQALSKEVAKLTKKLPKERKALVDFAADPTSLNSELEELLIIHGPAIWGRDADRTCLRTHVFYENSEDKQKLEEYLYQWIIIKAINSIHTSHRKSLKTPQSQETYLSPIASGPTPEAGPYDSSPPLNTAAITSNDFAGVNSVSARNPPVMQHIHHAHIAPHPLQPPRAQAVARLPTHQPDTAGAHSPIDGAQTTWKDILGIESDRSQPPSTMSPVVTRGPEVLFHSLVHYAAQKAKIVNVKIMSDILASSDYNFDIELISGGLAGSDHDKLRTFDINWFFVAPL